MTFGERMKKVRKELDLTQQDFGKRIGIKPNSISLIESGNRNASEQVILSICREFHVNENWLRTGEGEMFRPSPSSALDALAKEYGLSQFGRTVIEKMANLSDKQWAVFYDFAMDVISSMAEAAPELDTRTRDEKPVDEWTEADQEALEKEADEFAAMAREQFLSEKRQGMSALSANESDVG